MKGLRHAERVAAALAAVTLGATIGTAGVLYCYNNYNNNASMMAPSLNNNTNVSTSAPLMTSRPLNVANDNVQKCLDKLGGSYIPRMWVIVNDPMILENSTTAFLEYEDYSVSSIKSVLGAKQDIDAQDENGDTILLSVLKRIKSKNPGNDNGIYVDVDHANIVRCLLKYGADPGIKNKQGQDAISYMDSFPEPFQRVFKSLMQKPKKKSRGGNTLDSKKHRIKNP